MFLKKLGAGTLLIMALAVSVHGSTISFMVIETGIPEGIPTLDSSRLWEYALLDVFFSAGHIVSNAPILRAAERPDKNFPEEARAFLNEALEGGAEFFVVAALDYQDPPQAGTGDLQPQKVSLRLFKTSPHRFLYSQEYSAQDLRHAGKDAISNARNVARVMAAHLGD
jgi:hypothetical protein